jgi:hypothetical protein
MNRTLQVLENFKRAWLDLMEEVENGNIDADLFAEYYPFTKSFDDLYLDVEDWIGNIKQDISSRS